MSYRMMWKMMWLKARYGLRTYLFFLIATVLFFVLFLFQLYFNAETQIMENSYSYSLIFLYIPVLINQSMQTMEYSKCHYLVPKTEKDRKRFYIFQNTVKMMLSFLIITVLYVWACRLNPDVRTFIHSWYLMLGISSVIVVGAGGYTNFYYKKEKKRNDATYRTKYIISVIVMTVILLVGILYREFTDGKYGDFVAYGIIVLAIIYFLYHLLRFLKMDAVYENINKEEYRFISRSSNYNI